MKKSALITLISLMLLFSIRLSAQCDFNDNTAVAIGEVLIDSANCPGSGSITINTVTGGGGQYIYELVAGPVIRIIQSQNQFFALGSGTYTVRVTGCAGVYKDTIVTVPTRNTGTMNSMVFPVTKLSGFYCGATTDGRYVIYSTTMTLFGFTLHPGGTKPYRYQISTGTNFTSVPFTPGVDSVVFDNLTASTVYNVRITDACNNFITKTFTTGGVLAPGAVSVPSLAITRKAITGSCTGLETIRIQINDSASNTPYNPALAPLNKEYWGHVNDIAYLRIRVEDAATGLVYSDRNGSFATSFIFGGTFLSSTTNINGETGITGSGVGQYFSSDFTFTPGIILPFHYSGDYPAGAPLKITVFFPGGDRCGTIVPAYSKSYNITTGSNAPAPVKIAALSPACGTFSNKYFRLDLATSAALNDVRLIDVTGGSYNLVYGGNWFYTLTYSTFNIDYNGLITGNQYRVIVTDTCGNKDSLTAVFSPGGLTAAAPAISETVKPYFPCSASQNGAFYKIIVNPLPTGYYLSGFNLSGYGSVKLKALPNWNNTTSTAYMIDTFLPPGNYNYSATWVNACSGGVINRPVTITPQSTVPLYNQTLTLTQNNVALNCGVDGKTTLSFSGNLTNINTNYYVKNVRLKTVPGNHVFPIIVSNTFSLTAIDQSIPFYSSTNIADQFNISIQTPMVISTGQEGIYEFEMEVACPDGTVASTITRSINVASVVSNRPFMPNLKYSIASACDASDFKVIMTSQGGRWPLRYEYKLATDVAYTSTGNAGLDSVVTIFPAPPPGTIYDLRVTDACGSATTSRVSGGSLTGNFFIYQFPLDCILNPFDVRVGTSSILGAHYTWRRNGVIIAQGFNQSQATITGVSTDVITVDINAFDCYNRTATRTISFTNPCTIIILPIKSIKLTANRLSSSMVQLNWKTGAGQDVNYFEIEKGNDGSLFTRVSRVNAGSNALEHNYAENDAETADVTYYRIKITDSRGKFSYSNVIRVENSKKVKTSLQVVPNPAHDYITLTIGIEKIKPLKANIYNDKGQLVKQVTINAEETSTGKKLDISALSNGSYLVSLVDNWEVISSSRFIKQ